MKQEQEHDTFKSETVKCKTKYFVDFLSLSKKKPCS